MKANSLILLGLLLFCLSGCQDDSGRTIRIGIEEYNTEEQKVIGDELHRYIHSAGFDQAILPRQNNSGQYIYVESIFQTAITNRTLQTMDVFDWTIDILNDDSQQTAFALPGGHIYIYTGLLKKLDTESELFYILTHEIAYSDLGIVAPFLGSIHGHSEMGDIYLNNGHGEYEEMVETLHKSPYEFNQVIKADEFQAILFCENNFNFNSLALMALIEKGEDTWEWFKTRPNYNDRKERYSEILDACE